MLTGRFKRLLFYCRVLLLYLIKESVNDVMRDKNSSE